MMTRFPCKASNFVRAAALAAAFLATPASAAQSDEVDVSSLTGAYLAARTADVMKDIPSAAAFYKAAREADPANLFLLERALVLTAAAGDVDEATEFARELFDKAPNSHVARLLLALQDIRDKRFAEASKVLGEPGAGVLADLTSGLLIAWAKFGEGKVDEALTGLTELEGEEWYEPFKLLHSGYIALAAGRHEQALQSLSKAREADANAVRITEAYARALAAAGRKSEAEEALEEFLSRFPDNSLAREALADVRAGGARAASVATPLAGAAEALAGIGAAVGQEGGVEVASLYLRLALSLDPQTAGGLAALSLGNLLDGGGQSEAAIEVYEAIGRDQPFRAFGMLRAALALDRLDRTDEAEKAFREAIRRDPEDVQALISFANMLRGRDRFAEAAELYSQAIAQTGSPDKSHWSLFYFRGVSYERTDAWEKAEADLKKALQLSPDQPLVLNYLGYSWVDMGVNLDEALGMIRKAVELRPNDGYIVDSLGWAFYRLGRYDDAVRELERAVELRPDDPVIHDHLGDAYWKSGRLLEAQFQWRHARDFGAEGEDLELILRKIAEGRLIDEPPEKQKGAALRTRTPADGAPGFAELIEARPA